MNDRNLYDSNEPLNSHNKNVENLLVDMTQSYDAFELPRFKISFLISDHEYFRS